MMEWLRSFFRSLLPEDLFLNGDARPLPRWANSPSDNRPATSPANRAPAKPVAKQRPRAIWRDWVQQVAIEQKERLVVTESLCLAKLRLSALPANLTVNGSLDLRQCQRLRRIGTGLTVQGDLQIGGRCGDWLWYEDRYEEKGLSLPLCRGSQPPIRWLPAQLHVDGELILRQCHHLTGLPPDAELTGLWIEGCQSFQSLPEEMGVRGSLTLKGCPQLRTLPRSLSVGGDCSLIGLSVKSLPEQLHVGRDLVLECLSQLTQLPKHLVVGRNLIIRRCPITSIPDSIAIPGGLTLRHCARFESLPEKVMSLEKLDCHDCQNLSSIPETLTIRQSLRLTNCNSLTSLPAGLMVPYTLDLRGCRNLTGLPSRLKVGFCRERSAGGAALNIVDCERICELPADANITGPIDLAGSGIKDAPPMAWNFRLLWRGFQVESDVVFHPERLTPERILDEPNAEIRRLMLDRVGCEDLLKRIGAKTVDQDRDPGGERRLVDVTLTFRSLESRRFLLCRCPSTARVYFLRVPPTIATCHAAAAWLAGFDDPDAYRPIQET